MRLIDADALLERTAELEAVALEQVEKYEPLDNPSEWHIWSAILTERSAFKFDLMDAPTIAAEPTRHGHWEHGEDVFGMYCQCSECGNQYYGSYEFNYCPHCGAKMDEVKDE